MIKNNRYDVWKRIAVETVRLPEYDGRIQVYLLTEFFSSIILDAIRLARGALYYVEKTHEKGSDSLLTEVTKENGMSPWNGYAIECSTALFIFLPLSRMIRAKSSDSSALSRFIEASNRG